MIGALAGDLMSCFTITTGVLVEALILLSRNRAGDFIYLLTGDLYLTPNCLIGDLVNSYPALAGLL